ncbi:hypothetical protein POM88_019812 [Heracleum sosnowskyi]|uniref:Transposase-associated domain-containing protein n=1 Tax=Heracleum sosnowskyi TaxID=360622 RepID=A0AAD8ICM4_9APIA|nr:hypothetical protein POM88_019812 [Heracleum sosnowskyi]
MSSNRSWMQRRFDERNNITDEYKNGVKEFIDFAIKRKDTHGNIRCPCNECGNLSFHQPERVTYHLYRYGIMESYTTWDLHMETHRSRVQARPSSSNTGHRDDDIIKQPRYKRTLKGIMRAEWTYETASEKGRKREAFLNRCVKKFRRYYYYPKGFTKGEANSVVREHLRRTMKQSMFTMKKNASKEVEEALKKGENKKRHHFKPHFLEEDAWIGCCDYWETDGHEKMSKINIKNRKHLTFPHASGAMPFEQRRSAKEEETGEVMSELELFHIVYTKKHAELIQIKEAMERAEKELASQHGPDEPPLSPASRRKRNILVTLHARQPKKGKPFMYPHHTVRELLGPAEAVAWTNLSTPARIPEHAYEMMGRALNDVTDMVQTMNGVDEVPRSRLDEELRKLADGAYPSKDDPTQLVFWDQYMKIATNLTASLFGRCKKVVIEDTQAHIQDTQAHDEGNRDESNMAYDEGNTNGQNCDDGEGNGHDIDMEGYFNNVVPLSP